MGFSLLAQLGLSDLLATTNEEYVQVAARLAADRPRLRELRAGLRHRLKSSSICDPPPICPAKLEAAYRHFWQTMVWPANPRPASHPLRAAAFNRIKTSSADDQTRVKRMPRSPGHFKSIFNTQILQPTKQRAQADLQFRSSPTPRPRQ